MIECLITNLGFVLLTPFLVEFGGLDQLSVTIFIVKSKVKVKQILLLHVVIIHDVESEATSSVVISTEKSVYVEGGRDFQFHGCSHVLSYVSAGVYPFLQIKVRELDLVRP